MRIELRGSGVSEVIQGERDCEDPWGLSEIYLCPFVECVCYATKTLLSRQGFPQILTLPGAHIVLSDFSH